MNVLTEVCIEEMTLEEEYKAALAVWSDIRSKSCPSEREIAVATGWLSQVESKLANHRAGHRCH